MVLQMPQNQPLPNYQCSQTIISSIGVSNGYRVFTVTDFNASPNSRQTFPEKHSRYHFLLVQSEFKIYRINVTFVQRFTKKSKRFFFWVFRHPRPTPNVYSSCIGLIQIEGNWKKNDIQKPRWAKVRKSHQGFRKLKVIRSLTQRHRTTFFDDHIHSTIQLVVNARDLLSKEWQMFLKPLPDD